MFLYLIFYLHWHCCGCLHRQSSVFNAVHQVKMKVIKKFSYKFTDRFMFFLYSCNGIMFASSSGHWYDEHFYKLDCGGNVTSTCVRRDKCNLDRNLLQLAPCRPKNNAYSSLLFLWKCIILSCMQPVRLACGWWLILICSEIKVLLADCWWLVCSERKVLLAGGW
jgi:hypothetical protein